MIAEKDAQRDDFKMLLTDEQMGLPNYENDTTTQRRLGNMIAKASHRLHSAQTP